MITKIKEKIFESWKSRFYTYLSQTQVWVSNEQNPYLMSENRELNDPYYEWIYNLYLKIKIFGLIKILDFEYSTSHWFLVGKPKVILHNVFGSLWKINWF